MDLRYLTPLTPAEQLAQGLAASQPMAMADRVRFSELDTQNHVNNKAYIDWFERVRIVHLNQVIVPHYAPGPAPRVALHSASIRYHKEMLAEEPYIATAGVVTFRTSSLTLEQQIWSGDLRATMQAVMVMLRPDGSGARYPLPEDLCAHFIAEEGARRDA
ncbi:acyl-CoA thioesterase [Antarcticimicrobium sediminis]|uniref:Acyl-CoA thioesterase n=1 Tax=Antarcticimicrobium sediminis TaxID=2546227 RepID=A0A4R5EUA6_9RHOB|nr:acyl-CoA thioesterase [Antarcticimicrobium sediminis]TDE38459.1 acyl-CoA thioesterase [Antarcticimicrobium sediminis]